MENIVQWAVEGGIAVLLTVVWFLLRDKDNKQAELITKLFALHDEDAKTLTEHRVKIAENHYTKDELNKIVDGLKEMNREEFRQLNSKVDSLASTIMNLFKGKE